jgi:hypothetical protein
MSQQRFTAAQLQKAGGVSAPPAAHAHKGAVRAQPRVASSIGPDNIQLGREGLGPQRVAGIGLLVLSISLSRDPRQQAHKTCSW